MEEKMVLKPRISVLLPAMLGVDATRAAIDAWSAQTEGRQLQVLVMVPEKFMPSVSENLEMAPWLSLMSVGDAMYHQIRAIALQKVLADYVFFAEDHCLPDPDWTEIMLRRMDEGWDVVNASFRPGNRTSIWCQGSFLVGYGEWMAPALSGKININCGNNMCIRRDLLHQIYSNNPAELVFGSFLAKKIRKAGSQIFLEADACMRHFDMSIFRFSIREAFFLGMGYGAFRTEKWAKPVRWVYPLAMPAIGALHLRRGLVHYMRAGRACKIPPTAIFASVIYSSIWAFGEAVGALAGRQKVIPYLAIAEIKPVSKASVMISDAWEENMGIRKWLHAKTPGR